MAVTLWGAARKPRFCVSKYRAASSIRASFHRECEDRGIAVVVEFGIGVAYRSSPTGTVERSRKSRLSARTAMVAPDRLAAHALEQFATKLRVRHQFSGDALLVGG